MKRFFAIIILLTCNYIVYAAPVDKTRLLSLLGQTEFYIIAGNYERAAELRDQCIVMVQNLGADNDLSTISKLHNISHAYSEKSMFNEATKTESVLVEIFPLAFPKNMSDYALYLNDLSLYLLENKNIVLAAENIKKALSLIEDENDVSLSVIYLRAAEIYCETVPQRIDLSIKYQKKAIEIFANTYGKTSSKYLDELLYLAKYYENAKDYDNACNAYLEVLHARADDENEKDMQSFLPLLDRIISCSHKINNKEVEKECKELAFVIASQELEFHQAKYPSVEFPSSKDSLEELAISKKIDSYKKRLGHFNDDEVKTKQITEEINDYLATQPDSYGKAYFLAIETLKKSLMNDWSSAVEYGVEALRIFDKLGIITDKYVMVLCCVAESYNELSYPAKAYDYILRAFELRNDYLSSDNRYYLGILNDLALYSSKLGNYRDAIKYGVMAVKAKEPYIYSDSSYGYFNALNNLATDYGAIGQKDTELELLQHIVDRADEIDPSVLEYPESPFLYNLACSNLENKNYDQAIEVGLKVKEMREKWGEKHFLSNIYTLLAEAYRLKGQFDKALRFASQANDIQKEIGGVDNLSLSTTYNVLAKIYMSMGAFVDAEKMEKCSIDLAYNNIINNFIDLSADDRTSYWKGLSNLFNIRYPNYFYQAKLEDATNLYNKSALFAKGILLNSDTELSKLIIESGNENAYAKFQRLLLNRSTLYRLTSNDKSDAKISVDSLRGETDRIERELIKECKVYGDYTTNLRTTWKDVQGALSPNDVAIEFLSFPLIDKNDSILGKTLYAALILRKDYDYPRCIILFEEEELNKIGNSYFEEEMYSLIWGKIEKYLSGIDNVFFSPAGKLHNINIEVLPEIVNNQKNYYRVSSTRILASSSKNLKDRSGPAIIYGGIKYDATIPELIFDSKKRTHQESTYRGKIENLDLRYGWDYLPETLIEVKMIESALKHYETPTHIYTDTLGTEASFKALNGQSCKIIHLATHGFYYTESDSVKMQRAHLDFMANQIDRRSRSYAEDLSLTRSGLLMAGCNNILRGYEIPADIEDGVLFAKEIASMNLKNVELTTLSSCDSGLGDVTGDGVFGLQRAFKKAGAQSILMSLHKVDDEATRILMAEFYKNLLSGKSKHQSLKDAQKYLRQVENGKYDDPKYWAAFIMLDGID